MKKLVLGGNDAVAYAVKQCYVDVVSAYPITPQTSIIENIAHFIAKGEMKTRFIKVESEHSAMAAAIGSSVAGSRVFTATSSQGLLLMHEMLHWAAGLGTPIVMANANRAVAPPWSIWADQVDSLSQRDAGWIQFYASNSQEAYDLLFLSFRLSEKVKNPVMVCMDGFLVTHTKEPVETFEDEITDFIRLKETSALLDIDKPDAVGALAFPKDYMPVKLKQIERITSAKSEFYNIAEEFKDVSGKEYKPLYTYGDSDADIVLVAMGSNAETAHLAVDLLNKEGIKSKLVKIIMFRPFPKGEFEREFKGAKKIVVFDRNISMGKGGITKDEIVGALGIKNAIGVVCGLGGVDVTEIEMANIAKDVLEDKITEDMILWGEK